MLNRAIIKIDMPVAILRLIKTNELVMPVSRKRKIVTVSIIELTTSIEEVARKFSFT